MPAAVRLVCAALGLTLFAAALPAATPEPLSLADIARLRSVREVAVSADGELVGMACVHIDHFLFNAAIKVGHELVFWIEPEHRGGMLAVRMLRAVDKAVADRGAQVNRMAILSTSPDQAGALYERLGWTALERRDYRGEHIQVMEKSL